jgi:DNA-binding PadR family transcriptional regulator
MGRDISDLQKTILILCQEKGFLTCQDILRQVFGGREYGVAHATLSRTLTRLWVKNLITIWKTLSRYRTGVSLTDEGTELAQAILAEGEDAPVEG